MRRYRTIRRRGLGYPVFPDQFLTASGQNFAFSPQTPDSIVMSVLLQQNQQLPPDLAAKWAAAGHTSTLPNPAPAPPPPAPVAAAPAVNPSGQPVSTQTGAGLRLVDILYVAPNVYQCLMSDGSTHYCDVDGNPITYTPPVPTVTPAAGSTAIIPVSQPGQQAPSPAPLFLGPRLQAPGATATAPAPSVAVTPAGTPISTVTAAPAPAAAAPTSSFDLSSITTWLQGSLVAGISNWLLVGAVALFLFSGGDDSPTRRRR